MPESQPPETPPQPAEQSDGAIQFQTEQTTHGARVGRWALLLSVSGVAHSPLTARQKLWRLAGLALTLALVALLFSQQIWTMAGKVWTAAFPQPLAVAPTCLVDGEWSPTGSHLAILGYRGTCGGSGHLAPVLNIYEGAGRLRVRQIALDPLLAPALKSLPRAVNTDRVVLDELVWMRGERQLAMTFTLPPRSDIGKTSTRFGIVVLDPNSANPHPFVRFYAVPNRPEGSYPLPGVGVAWDLTTGEGKIVSGNARFYAWDNPLPLAYQYAWTGAGDLVPDAGAGTGAQAQEAVGAPQYSSTFQVWQSGWLTGLTQANAPFPGTGDAQAFFQTTFAAASPNGRYLVAPLAMKAPVSPRLAGSSPQAPEDSSTLPMLLARDVGFAQILRVTQRYAHRPVQPIIYVAWRPDGKAVATFNLNDDQKVNIYDCATGRLLASRVEPRQSPQFNGVLGTLRWSPDGKRLLLLDGAILTL